MCKNATVRHLPKSAKIRDEYLGYSYGHRSEYSPAAYEEARTNPEMVLEDCGLDYQVSTIIKAKFRMLLNIRDTLKADGCLEFDCFNGLAPTRINLYKSYEFSAVWVWAEIVHFLKNPDEGISDSWYAKYKSVLASTMRKYPKITGVLISIADLHVPGNKLLDYSKMEDANFDDDHTDESIADDKAEEFKTWILTWCNKATEKDKMRVRRWFETKKSHKQIFAEIQKVVGNSAKFNARLALFVERLFNQDGLDYFFEKTGFATKEDMFMAYFDKLTQFDEETKKAFIKKYLV